MAVLAAWALTAHAEPARLTQVEAGQYLEHVKFLAAPERQGRGAGTEGIHQAAEYIVEQFKSIGLKPAGEGKSFLQPFTVTTGAEMGSRNHFRVRQQESEQVLAPQQDYIPLNFSSTGAISGPLVFAGYGVSADEFDYDDYFHLDVKDKIVVVLRYEPKRFAEKRGGERRRYTHHAHLISKAINARNHGAKGIVLVNGRLEEGKEDELVKFGSISGPGDAGIVMVQATRAAAQQWFEAAGKSLAEVQESIDSQGSPQSFALPASLTASLEVDIERKQATVHNVAGYLPGKSKEYLVIGAHYDHLGFGDDSSLAPSQIGEVHYGADDNASGTAGVIELARILSSRPKPAERGVLFMAFAGEEIGLLGSAYWANNPTYPIEQAIAMINLDMIGRISQSKVYVGGADSGTTFKPLLEKVLKRYEFDTDPSAMGSGGYSASDHTSFVAKKIPALFFFSGLHSDYHKPSDTWDKINAKGAARLLDMVADVASELVAADKRPEFVKVERPGQGHGGDGAGGGYGPYFGSVPDFGQIENGVKFADIRAGSPAAKGGLQAGDILIQFGERPIKNLYDFTYALRDSKVGDVVEVRFLRDGETHTAQVTLEQRQ